MAGIPISGLGRKLRLLIDYGHFEEWEDLAKQFGVKGSTIQWWGHADAGRMPDTLPSRHYGTLLDLLGDCFDEPAESPAIKSLLSATVAEFESTLAVGSAGLLSKLIEREAITDGFRLFNSETMGLVETDEEDQAEPGFKVPLGQYFRLEVSTTSRAAHAFALQNSGKSWGIFPATVDLSQGRVLLPGKRRDGRLGRLRELEQQGISRFIAIQTPDPAPIEIMSYYHEKIALDRAGLGRISAFYNSQKKSRRAMFITHIEFETP